MTCCRRNIQHPKPSRMGFLAALTILILNFYFNLVNSKATHNFTLSNGDVILCVRIQDQVSLRGIMEPIEMRPSAVHQQALSIANTSSLTQLTQLFSKEFGSCGNGRIPVQYTRPKLAPRKGLLLRHTRPVSPETTGETHEYGITCALGNYRGLKTSINIWQPYVEEAGYEFSLSQLWVFSARDTQGNSRTSIEAGWQVDPARYGGYYPRLFIFWTTDGYNTGCYNNQHCSGPGCPSDHHCSGFVQVDNTYVLGGAISTLSLPGSTQYEYEFFVFQDSVTGNWWLGIGTVYVGYWPASILPDLANGASELNFGGEVFYNKVDGVPHTRTDMGSGNFPNAGYGYAAYHRRIEFVDENWQWQQVNNLLASTAEAPTCYAVGEPHYDDPNNWGTYFFFGGSGYNSACT